MVLQKSGTRFLSAIGRQEWLDRPSYRVEHLLSFVYNAMGSARDRVTNALNGVWLGHPVHPPLASFASGALGTTVALDALRLLPARPDSETVDTSRIASRSLGLGILASIGAAVTGVTDWQHTHYQDRRVGLVHGMVNSAATALYAWSWWDRCRGRNRRGIALSAIGYGVTVAGSFLGGALVFESGIGMDQSGQRLRAKEWTPVLPATSLNGKPVRVEVDGVGLVVCQTNPGEVSASASSVRTWRRRWPTAGSIAAGSYAHGTARDSRSTPGRCCAVRRRRRCRVIRPGWPTE